ncbi:hypothetical protein JB92DRAFT_1225332 [Gautieria morchelliformis]|nr:hypothetical protein JB92DRAFT_1225332 [Gautieria morchelliformis]
MGERRKVGNGSLGLGMTDGVKPTRRRTSIQKTRNVKKKKTMTRRQETRRSIVVLGNAAIDMMGSARRRRAWIHGPEDCGRWTWTICDGAWRGGMR